MKKDYRAPELLIVRFEDVITSSGESDKQGEDDTEFVFAG